jgi:NADH:ubiquinone oxidoreductase subunit 3 (subunit A)
MLESYLPIVIFLVVGLPVGVGPIMMGFLLGPQRPDSGKNTPCECGFEAFEDSGMRFPPTAESLIYGILQLQNPIWRRAPNSC